MKRLLRYFLNLTIVLLGLGVGATLLSSPVHVNSNGTPALNWHKASAQSSKANLSLFVWPMTETAQTINAIPVAGYENSAGIIVMTATSDSRLSDTVVKHLEKAHQSSSRDASWAAKLTQKLEEQANVNFAWIDVREAARPRLDGQALDNQLKLTQAKVTHIQQALKTYEVETAVLTDQLNQQWSERLVRQSIEDTGTITVMRARAMQALRLRLAKSSVTDSETRLEGLSAIENVRLDYLSSLNTLLKDTSDEAILHVLEDNSVYQSPMLSAPASNDPTNP